MRNCQGIIFIEREHIGIFSNLHWCTLRRKDGQIPPDVFHKKTFSQKFRNIDKNYQKLSCNFIQKRLPQMFSCEYWEISTNPCLEEHLRTAASEVTLGSDCLRISFWRGAFKNILT